MQLPAHAEPGDALPALTPWQLLTGWHFEVLPAVGALAVGALYLYAVHRLRARGDSWSRWRTIFFVGLGLGSFVLATQSALAAYDAVLLWVHMVQHMILTMLTPVFLALGSPVTLALRTLPAFPRDVLLRVLHSRVAKVLSFPVVSGALFIANPFALYFTGWYEATLRNGLLHDLNHLHFLAIGCLWFWPLLSLDPMPSRLPYPLRLIAVFVTMPFHAFLGVAIMGSSSLLARDWYEGLERTWGPSLAEDQEIAGAVLWVSGELVALVVLAVLFVQWARESRRDALRQDRRLDRIDAQRRAATGAPPRTGR